VAERADGLLNLCRRAAVGAPILALVLVFGTMANQSAQAQTFTTLYNFTGSSDGGYPYGNVVSDPSGGLYGTTYYGGTAGLGVVFKLDTAGTETVLHSFKGGTTDGEYPFAGLVRDKAGNLYGTTESDGPSGYGVVFKVDSGGTESVLYGFAGGTTDGCVPLGGLIRDKSGNLYGTTEACGASDYGIVFKLDKKGKETVLHSFGGGSSDGAFPLYTSLLMDKNGNLYGVTEEGGSSNEGVLYKLSKKGVLTVFHSFTGSTTDGCYPFGAPLMDGGGNFYGTTESCGSSGYGIVFKVDKKGRETVLHSFAAGTSDGAYPFSGVISDAKGNLYGDAQGGGASGEGVVYKLSKSGMLTLRHSFSGSDGAYPLGGLLRGAKGALYGTTEAGGTSGYGTVWSLK